MEKRLKVNIVKIILGVIAASGVLAAALAAPNALKIVDLFYKKRRGGYNVYKKRYYVKTVIGKMKKRGLIKFENSKNGTLIGLTEKGQQELLKYQMREKVIEKPKKWDKKWRVIIFDIKEVRKITRENLRKELINLGFLRLQNSVWVYPYECQDIIIMLKSYFRMGKDILYLVVERLEDDKWLKSEFNLS